MDKRYQVFISSTFADLEDERKAVMEAILECNCYPAGMEMFPALDMDQFEFIKAIIDKSDYYILIVAGRYGSLAPDKIGYTEKEYKYAIEKGIPVLAFVKRDIDNIPAKHTDQDRNLKKRLIKFRQEIGIGRLINMWDDRYELKSKISLSLREAFESNPRTGWVRANEAIKTKGEDLSKVFEKLQKDMALEIIAPNDTTTICIKLIDIVMIIGSFDKPILSDDYEINVREYIIDKLKNCTLEVIFEVFYNGEVKYSLSDINKKLCVLKVASVAYTSEYDIYSIGLTDFGKKLYEKAIIDSI
jgi:hypothetical protein